ncbi:MAG TPA: hypothetical protein VL359_16340, partial [bacterium]|nr:hypothetical protein [bacterium]
MAAKTAAALIALLLLLGGACAAEAEDLGEFSFVMGADGAPRFTQVLRWSADPNVLYYQVTVQTGAGDEVGTWKVETPALTLNLAPGAYRYRVVLYNLLGKPEVELPWHPIEVRKAEVPHIASCAPRT